MRISDWSSDVCSSDLIYRLRHLNSRTETPSPQGCAVSYRRGEELRAEAMRCVQRALWENYRQHKRAHRGELPCGSRPCRIEAEPVARLRLQACDIPDRKSTRLNSSH